MKGRYAKRVLEGRCPKCGRDDEHTTFGEGKVTCTPCLEYQKRWTGQNAEVVKSRKASTTISHTCGLCEKHGGDEGMVLLTNVNSSFWRREYGTEPSISAHYTCLAKFMLAGT